MTSLNRYDLMHEGSYDVREGVMTLSPHGDWVSAEDYDTLDIECERLRSIIKDATASAKDALAHLTDA